MITSLNADNIFSKGTKPATVRIAPNGFIRFSSDAVEKFKLTEDARLEFFLDSEKKEVIYFCLSDDGLPLRLTNKNKKSPSLQICCRPLPFKLLTHLQVNEGITIRLYPDQTATIKGRKCWVMDKFNKHIPTKWK